MRRRWFIAVLLAFAAALHGQESRRVSLDVYAPSKKAPLKQLNPAEIEFTTKNGMKAKVLQAEYLGDRPLHLAIILDDSGSMRDFRQDDDLTKNLLNGIPLVANLAVDKVMIAGFSDQPYIYCEFTSDMAVLKDVLKPRVAKGASLLRDSVGAIFLQRLQKLSTKERVAVLLLTDGMDNKSKTSQEDLERIAVQMRIPIYTMWIQDYYEGKGLKALKSLANATGGQAFSGGIPQITGDMKRMGEILRSQFLVSVDVPPGFEWEDVKLVIGDRNVRPVFAWRAFEPVTPVSSAP